jgi:ABC-2 type transport system ATP-binding protein
MIEVSGLIKRFGDKVAVDDLSFTVQPGMVTGLLGPNGAGKTTTMRVILGLDDPTAGIATVAGRRYVDLPRPMRTLSALIDAKAAHPSRTAYHHLLCLAQSNGIPKRRVQGSPTRRPEMSRTSGWKFLESQRLGIAATLLGD